MFGGISHKKLRTGKIVGISVSVAIVSLVIAYSIAGFLGKAAPDNASNQRFIRVQWIYYPTLYNLTTDADAIIVGKVVEVKGIREQAATNDPITIFSVTAETVLKGELKPSSAISVEQLGGSLPNKQEIYLVDSDPLMKVGEEYVMFLGYTPSTDSYASLGGPEGKFLVRNAMVYSMDYVHPESVESLDVKENGKSLPVFLSEITDVLTGKTLPPQNPPEDIPYPEQAPSNSTGVP